ncbi:MAG: oligosaccharide flippase family protein [Cyanobacteria bacterium P01_A01_bin.84]
MKLFNQLTALLKKIISNQFIRNLGWLGIAEFSYRFIRLGIVVVLARYLNEYDYTLGGIVLMVREFALTFSNIGIGAKIIHAEEKELKQLCNSAYWLNWLIFASLFIIQCLVAFPVAFFKETPELILPICVSGIAYLIWPITIIQKNLLQRENRFKVIAITDSILNPLAGLLSALFAFFGMGVWAFALPPVLVAPLEIFIYLRNHSWRSQMGFTTKYWRSIWNFGRHILGVDLLKTFMNNLDYLVLFLFMTNTDFKEFSGGYFWAFNAGLGISLSLIKAIKSAIFPHFCAARTDLIHLRKRYFSSLKIIAVIIIPIVILQFSLAPIYVPIVFSAKWSDEVPLFMLICLSAIPRPFADAASQLLVAIGKPYLDLVWNFIFTGTYFSMLLIGVNWKNLNNIFINESINNNVVSVFGVHWQLMGVAASVLLAHIICLPLFSIWVTRRIFPKHKSIVQ